MKIFTLLSALLFGLHALPALPTSTRQPISSDPAALLHAYQSEYGFHAEEDFRFDGTLDVPYGKIYRFTQVRKGVEVEGGQFLISTDEAGRALSVNSTYRPIGEVAHARLGLEQARELLLSRFPEAEILSAAELISADTNEPCYRFVTDVDGGTDYTLSALDGTPIKSAPVSLALVRSEQTDAFGNPITIETDAEEGEYVLRDSLRNLYVFDANHNANAMGTLYRSEDGVFEDHMAVSVFDNLVKAYDFYADARNIGVSRRGLDGNSDEIENNGSERGEIPIYAYVHFDRGYENAAFTYRDRVGGYLLIGDGVRTGTVYEPGKALDVIAHEYQHGITYFTAGLDAMNEPGALNEAFSDVFGALIEGHDLSDEEFWLIGENASGEGLSALRSMKDPREFSCADSVAEMFPLCRRNHNHELAGCDYGNIHLNSTVISHVAYKLFSALPEFFTKERMGELWYSTLCSLTHNATFAQFGTQFKQAAVNLGYDEEVLSVITSVLADSGLMNVRTVRFLDAEDNLLKRVEVEVGGTATPPEPPLKKSDSEYDYEFAGWDCTLENITTDLTVRPLYTPLRCYTVRFMIDGKTVKTERVRAGGSATPPSDPVKPDEGDLSYEFWYWSEDAVNVNSDLDITAYFREIPKAPQNESGGGGCGGVVSVSAPIWLLPAIFLIRRKKR